MSKTYTIEGMKCMGCVHTVEEKFSSVPGVTEVKVDLKGKTAEVTGTATKEELAASLSETKFTLA